MMKIYFQVQSGRKLRVYRNAMLDEQEKKRKQETLAVLSADDEIPAELLSQLSNDDKMRLVDNFELLRNQVEYERVRDALMKLPPVLDKASKLFTAGRLSLSKEQKDELRDKITILLKHLK